MAFLKELAKNALGLIGLAVVSQTSQYGVHGASGVAQDEQATADAINSIVDFLSGGPSVGGPVLFTPPLSPAGDDGAHLTSKLKSQGYVWLVPGANYNIETPVVISGLPAGWMININGANLVGAMAQTGGNANSIIFGTTLATAPIVTTTIAAAGVSYGSNQMTATSAAAIVQGQTIRVTTAASPNVRTYYKVDHKAGATATLDRSVLFPFAAGDEIAQTANDFVRVQRGTILFGGGTITGSGDRGIYLEGGYEVSVSGPGRIDCSQGGALTLSGGIVFDVGCVDCTVEKSYVDGFSITNNADSFDYGIRFASCEQCTITASRASHFTVAGFLNFDCMQCSANQLRAFDATTALATGLGIGGTGAANPNGCLECVYEDCSFSGIGVPGGFAAWALNIDRAIRSQFYGFHVENCRVRYQLGFTSTTDILLSGCTAVGNTAYEVTGFNEALIVGGGGAPGCRIEDFTAIDCGSQMGLAQVLDLQSDIIVDGLTTRNPTVSTARVVRFTSTVKKGVLRNADITLSPAGAAAAFGGVAIDGSAGSRFYLSNVTITCMSGAGGDVGIQHNSNGVVELRDVEVLNPLVVPATSGYVGTAGTCVRRPGRFDASGTTSPFTANESDRGSFDANGATVTIPFFDIMNLAPPPALWLVTPAGAVNRNAESIAITAGVNFAVTFAAGDTGRRGYEIVN
jgi:hypothetical protein